jgi:hypothetical protein
MPVNPYDVEVQITAHGDGCVIAECHIWWGDVDEYAYEKYATGTQASRILHQMAGWAAAIERGEPASCERYERLELPFEPA